MEQFTGFEKVGLRMVFCPAAAEPPGQGAAVPLGEDAPPGGDTPADISDGFGELDAEEEDPPPVAEYGLFLPCCDGRLVADDEAGSEI